jgi:hypothetical protein
MTHNDVNQVIAWLQQQSLTTVDPSRRSLLEYEAARVSATCGTVTQECVAVATQACHAAAQAAPAVPGTSRGAKIVRGLLTQAGKLPEKVHRLGIGLMAFLANHPGIRGCLEGIAGSLKDGWPGIAKIILGCVHGYLDGKSGRENPPFSNLRVGPTGFATNAA